MRKSYTSVRAMAVARSLRCRVRRLFSSECIHDLSVSWGTERRCGAQETRQTGDNMSSGDTASKWVTPGRLGPAPEDTCVARRP